jgi:hypothetical protein
MAKTSKAKTKKKPSKEAMAAAEAMLAPLHDLLKASVKQNEMNAAMLADLKERVVSLATQLDVLQAAAKPESKLLTEPAPVPTNGVLLEEFRHEPKGNIP